MNYPGSLYERKLADGRVIVVYRLLFGCARLCIGPDDGLTIDDEWHYESGDEAIFASAVWDGEGEPSQWHRHPGSGRRRPDGDPNREYVNL